MTRIHPLLALAEGRAEGYAAVLQNCRLEGLGGYAYGGEDIQAFLRRASFSLTGGAVVAAPDLAFVMGLDADGATAAAVADMHAGWIVRLWMLGTARSADESAPRVCTPFDLDLDQRGGQLAFAPEDHPRLSPGHADAVRALGGQWLASPSEALVGRLRRPRPLVLRAASQGDRAAALFRLQGGCDHGLGGFFAAAMFDGAAEPTIIVDAAGREAALAAPWTPILRQDL